jgi:hypothetical protein
MKNVSLLIIMVLILILAGCSINKTKADTFPLMYQEKPLTILILPPINLSTAPEAKEYLMTTLSETVSETGYYFLPLEVTSPFLKAEGLYDTEIITDEVLPQFKEFFNADAVLITKIVEWDKSYYVVGGNVTVALDFSLRSTNTSQELWSYKGKIVYNTSGDSNNGLLLALVQTAIQTAAQDYVPIAKAINQQVFQTVPVGKYHPRNNLDQGDSVQIK